MNILFVHNSFRIFDKLDCGAANRNTVFVEALSKIAHVDVISFYGEQIVSNIENCEVIFNKQIPFNNKWNKILTILRLLVAPWLPYGYYQQNKEYSKIVDNQLNCKNYDFVACRYIETAVVCGLSKYSSKLILDVDDNPSNVYKNILLSANFRYFWSKWLHMWKLLFIGYMAKRFLNKVRISFFSNIMESPSKKSVFLHNVSALGEKIPDIDEETPLRILTVGHLNYPPNKFGTKYFVDNIFPKIKAQVRGVELCVIGKIKDKKLFEYLNGLDGVMTLGYVENISSAYQDCRVIVIPIYMGTGSCVKFAEGLSMNRPIVSTPTGARGFEHICKTGEHFILANNDDEFVQGVVKLLNSRELSKKIANNACVVSETHFSKKCFYDIVANTVRFT